MEEKNVNLKIIPPNFAKAIAAAVTLFLTVLIICGIVWINNKIKENKYIGQGAQFENTISISGEGKVLVTPDIGQVDLSVVSDATSVAPAQKDNADKMSEITKAMKDLGIKDEDLKTTNYSIYPRYQYSHGKNEIIGYEVTQTLEVKIRNLDKVGDVLGQAASLGANQVGSLSFTFDDPESLQSQARQKAIANAKQKADDLAKSLGVTLGKVVSFSESVSGMPSVYPMAEYGIGGGGDAASAPTIQTGQNEIQANVTLSYEIY
jgi:uncharacterized protein YggE